MKICYNGNRPVLIKLDGVIIGKGFKIYVNKDILKGKHTIFVEELTAFDSNISFLNIFNPLLFVYQFKLGDGEPLIKKENNNSKSFIFELLNENDNNTFEICLKNNPYLYVDSQKSDLSFRCIGDVRIISKIENEISNDRIKRQKYIYIFNTVFYVLVVLAFMLIELLNSNDRDTFEMLIVFIVFMILGVVNIFKIRKQ